MRLLLHRRGQCDHPRGPGREAAPGRRRRAGRLGRALTEEGPRGWAAPLHAHVLDAAAVGPGTRLLDLGCGPGVLARVAADRGAHVVGVDADRSAVALAAAAVPEGRFRVGDVHELPEPDGSLDVVTAVQLLTHVANPLKVLRAAARVLARPRGVMVATVWGRERECDMRGFGEALAEWLPGRRPPAGPPRLTEPDRLRKLAGLACLTVVTLDEVRCPFDYPDADALLDPLLASGIGRHALARAGPAAVRRAVLERFATRRTPEGGYRLENLFRVLVARP